MTAAEAFSAVAVSQGKSLAEYIIHKSAKVCHIGRKECLVTIGILGIDFTGRHHHHHHHEHSHKHIWNPKGQVWCPRHGHYYDAQAHQHKELMPQSNDPTTETGLTVVEDFVAGSLAGVASTVVGHPFDTIKVRLQMPSSGSKEFTSATECLIQSFRMEGISGLYRGLMSPMTTMPLVNAVVFGSYGQAKSFFQSRHEDKSSSLTSKEAMLAGGFAGLVNSVVLTPVELIKCRLQAQGEAIGSCANRVYYRGSWDCIRHIVLNNGIGGLWKGQAATIFREVPSYVGQFGTYELLKDVLGAGQEDTSVFVTLVSGGIAGCVCWTVSYPQDIVKSRLQLLPDGGSTIYKPLRFLPDGGFFHCMRSMVKKEGWRALWKGYTPCLLRAFPANGAGFFMYEMAKSSFTLYNEAYV